MVVAGRKPERHRGRLAEAIPAGRVAVRQTTRPVFLVDRALLIRGLPEATPLPIHVVVVVVARRPLALRPQQLATEVLD